MAIIEFLPTVPGERRQFRVKSPVDLADLGQYTCASTEDVAAAVAAAFPPAEFDRTKKDETDIFVRRTPRPAMAASRRASIVSHVPIECATIWIRPTPGSVESSFKT